MYYSGSLLDVYLYNVLLYNILYVQINVHIQFKRTNIMTKTKTTSNKPGVLDQKLIDQLKAHVWTGDGPLGNMTQAQEQFMEQFNKTTGKDVYYNEDDDYGDEIRSREQCILLGRLLIEAGTQMLLNK